MSPSLSKSAKAALEPLYRKELRIFRGWSLPAGPIWWRLEEAAAVTADSEDAFGATTVIPDESLPFNKKTTRVQAGSVSPGRGCARPDRARGPAAAA